jgi:hypothetical protein
MRLIWALDRTLRAAAILTASVAGLFIFMAGLFAVIARNPLVALAGFGIWAIGGALVLWLISASFRSQALTFSGDRPNARKAICVTLAVYGTGFTGIVLALWKSAELWK